MKILTIFIIFTLILNNSIFTKIIGLPTILQQLMLYGSLVSVFLIKVTKVHFNKVVAPLIAAAVISLMLNKTPAVYQAPQRLFLWVLLLSTVGPFMYNQRLIFFRQQLLRRMVTVLMYTGVICFCYWLLPLPYLGRGHFSGIFKHSMVLAPFAALGSLYAFYAAITEKHIIHRNLLFGVTLINIFCVTLAGSRSALLSCLASFSIFFIFSTWRYRKLAIIAIFTLTGYLSYQTLHNGMTLLSDSEKSITHSLTERGMDNTREFLWLFRIREFYESPYYGVGFNTVRYEKSDSGALEGGAIEPGSSYLAVLSMTGIWGVLAFLLLLKRLFKKSTFSHFLHKNVYIIAIYTFFFLHFIGEGYIFAAGAPMGFVFWLLVGATFPYKQKYDGLPFFTEAKGI